MRKRVAPISTAKQSNGISADFTLRMQRTPEEPEEVIPVKLQCPCGDLIDLPPDEAVIDVAQYCDILPNGIELIGDSEVIMIENSGNGRYHYPDNFQRLVIAAGYFCEPYEIIWHWQFGEQDEDTDVNDMLIVRKSTSLMVIPDNTPDYVHSITDLGDLRVWYEYPPLDYVSDEIVISFVDGGAFTNIFAVGSVNEAGDPPDMGVTTRTYQFVEDTTSGKWRSVDFDIELFIADARAVERVVEWHWIYTGLAQDEVPAGMVFKQYGQTKVMNGGALAIGLEPAKPCDAGGLDALGTLTVWCTIDGVDSLTAELEFISTGSITC